jgi:hypothetical protein
MTQNLKILQDMQDALDDAYAAGIRNSKREWVGLTKKEVHDLYDSDYVVFYQRIEATLKAKNSA